MVLSGFSWVILEILWIYLCNEGFLVYYAHMRRISFVSRNIFEPGSGLVVMEFFALKFGLRDLVLVLSHKFRGFVTFLKLLLESVHDILLAGFFRFSRIFLNNYI